MKISLYTISLLLVLSAWTVLSPYEKGWTDYTISEMTDDIKKIESFYKNTGAYSIKVTHKTFKNYTTQVTEDISNGYFIRDAKGNYHSYNLGIHTIQNARYKLTIDSLNQTILLSEPDDIQSREVKTSDLKDALKVCTQIKKSVIDKETHFKFEFGSNSVYKTYEIAVNNQWQIKKITVYFNKEIPSDLTNEKSLKTKPRGEIYFTNYKTGIQPDYKKYFDESVYIILKNDVPEGTGNYKTYTVYDLRVKK